MGGSRCRLPPCAKFPSNRIQKRSHLPTGLERGEFDLVVLLTGVGTRALIATVEQVRGSRDSFIDALRRSRIVARGPKPVAALRDVQVPVWLTAPEPNTWRELLSALDSRASELSLKGLRVAVQEYGVSNPDLLAGLRDTWGSRNGCPGLSVGVARGFGTASRSVPCGGRRQNRRRPLYDRHAGRPSPPGGRDDGIERGSDRGTSEMRCGLDWPDDVRGIAGTRYRPRYGVLSSEDGIPGAGSS